MEWKYTFRNSGERSCRKDLKEKKKYPGAVRGLQKERDSTPPLHRWLKWEEWEDKKKRQREKTEIDRKRWKEMCTRHLHTPNRMENKCETVCLSADRDSVWVCGCVGACPFFCFCDSQGLPRSRADPLSLSCPLFIHLSPAPPKHTLFFFSFLYTHSSSPPSLLAQRWMALSFWWVTDEWSSSLKSRVTARPVKREEMPDKRWQRARGEREGREEKRGRGGEGTCGGGTVNIIKSVRDGGSMCVAERARSAFLHECLGLFALWCSKGQHHANGK